MLNKKLIPLLSVAVLLSACGKEGGGLFGLGASNDRSAEVGVSKSMKETDANQKEVARTNTISKSGFTQRIIGDALFEYPMKKRPSVFETRTSFITKPDLLDVFKLNEETQRDFYVSVATATIAPVRGFPAAAYSGDVLNPKAARKEAIGVTASLLFANELFQPLDQAIKKTTVRDQFAAKQAVIALNKTLPLDDLKAYWLSSVEQATAKCANISFNTTSSEGMSWQCPDGGIDVAGDKSGFVLMVGGKELFGKGFINGLESKIAFDDSNSVTITEGSEVGSDKSLTVKGTKTSSASSKTN